MREDRPAFECLFRTHYRAVYRYVLRRVEEDAAQDVVAETFLVAWRRHEEISGDPLPWLLGVARRLCANHLRGRHRRAALDDRLAAEPEPEAPAATAIADGQLGRALGRLRPADREALLLVAWDGLSNRDAARALGCSAPAFAVRLHRARGRLARLLGEEPTDHAFTGTGVEGMATSDVQ
jgi:RNA polymerase sigma-70 factor (ECF subfamily)